MSFSQECLISIILFYRVSFLWQSPYLGRFGEHHLQHYTWWQAVPLPLPGTAASDSLQSVLNEIWGSNQGMPLLTVGKDEGFGVIRNNGISAGGEPGSFFKAFLDVSKKKKGFSTIEASAKMGGI